MKLKNQLKKLLLLIFGSPHKNKKIQKNIKKIFGRNPKNNSSEKMMLECL